MHKTCYKCGQVKTELEFYRKKSTKDGLQTHCKDCHKVLFREYYKANKVRHRRAVSERSKKHVSRLLADIDLIKRENGCQRCHEHDPKCLDFHHVDATEKEFNIARMRGWARERIFAEIAKCCVLCSNCHRKLHAGRYDGGELVRLSLMG